MGLRMAHGNTLPSGIIVSPKKGKKINPKQGREKIHTEKSGVGQLSITRGQSVFYKKG
jgi:methyl coenzyme M reductase subunit D